MPSTWRNSLQVFVQLILSVILQGSYYKGGSAVENLTATAGDLGSILGSGWSPEGWNGNPLQYSSWEILWTQEPGGLQSMRLQRVGHDLATIQQQQQQGRESPRFLMRELKLGKMEYSSLVIEGGLATRLSDSKTMLQTCQMKLDLLFIMIFSVPFLGCQYATVAKI